MAQLLRLINKGTSDLQGDTTAANITATKFVKRGYSNDNILLGGGESPVLRLTGLLNSAAYYNESNRTYDIETWFKRDEFIGIFDVFDSFGKTLTDVNNNILYRADLRHTVTLSGFFFGSDDPKRLFDLNYESTMGIQPNVTAEILIELSDVWTYSYGYIVVSFYNNAVPDNVEVEMQTIDNSDEYTWHSIPKYTNTHANIDSRYIYGTKNAKWVFNNNSHYYCKAIKIKITGKELHNTDPTHTALNQILFYGTRMVLAESPILSKYLDLDIPYLNITAKSCKIANASSSQFLKGDGSLDSTTYSTSTHTHYIGTTAVQKISATQNLSGIGALSCADITCTSITETSDIRKKTNIHKLDYDTYKLIDDISPCRFMYKDDTSESYRIGLIAQDVENIFPEVVHTDKDGFKSIEYSKLGVLAIDMIKRLKQEILKLDDRIKYLENKNG